MHKILEFQAVVLAAGRGSRLPDVGGAVSKCLLPVGPYPVVWYSLNLLEKIGFQGILFLHNINWFLLLKNLSSCVSFK